MLSKQSGGSHHRLLLPFIEQHNGINTKMFQFPCIKGYSQGTAVQMFSFSIVKGTLDHCLIDINSFRSFDRHTQPSFPKTKPYGRQPCLYFSLRPSLLPGQHSALQKIWPKTTNTSPQNLKKLQ